MKSTLLTTFLFLSHVFLQAQLNWVAKDSLNKNLPKGVIVYYTNDSLDGKPNIAYYIEADLKNKNLIFDVDTTLNRRLTPKQFYEKNNKPSVLVNGTFFSFQTNQNLNVVIKNKKVVAHNLKKVQRKGADSIMHQIPINRSAIGIDKNRNADVAWIKTDSSSKFAYANQQPFDENFQIVGTDVNSKWLAKQNKKLKKQNKYKKWRMESAIGGGPVLIQNGEINITNEFEQMFTGKAINDKHPRTAIGYTNEHKLIILVIQGRFPNIAEGATLLQEAAILKKIGCYEALNLDGGGSSCMLINGFETIKPSDKGVERAIPAIFMIKTK